MKPGAQVLHVLRKDVRQNAWVLAAYGVLVLMAALGLRGLLPAQVPLVSSVWISLTGALAVAVSVQADSATRGDVLWRTLPLRSGAVATAKLALLALLLLFALAAQAFALAQFRLPLEDTARMLANSAVMYALFLSIAALAAALTSDLRALALAVVGALIGSILLTTLFLATSSSVDLIATESGTVDVPWHLLLLPAALVLLVVQYRTRLLPGGIPAALVICLASLAALTVNPPVTIHSPAATATRVWQPLRPDFVPELEASRFIVPDPSVAEGLPMGRLHLRIRGGSREHRYELYSEGLEVSTASAYWRDMRLGGGMPILLRWPAERATDTPPIPTEWVTTSVSVHADTAAARAVQTQGARLRLSGRIVVSEAQYAASVDLRRGATTVIGGYRIRYQGREGRSLRITSLSASIDTWRIGGGRAQGPLSFVLVRADGSKVPLELRDRGSTRAPMVLPGTEGLLQDQWLVSPQGINSIPPDAKLSIYHWRAVGAQDVELTVPRDVWRTQEDASDVVDHMVAGGSGGLIAVPLR